ncbi:sugar phosphate isomerase/epimerase [Saccharibacillus sp. CPCC 101409]|uniref:sugar phosphate isomerase/epimerase family protein n=1 Tax=Saccharibacillus sp. CPCC 101409 TaxID=3058041 RepID=UPI002671FAA8|nr:sugar phosphate isomerase/epimerase [Saccharibacillus sp. CPCC 101409]MDO3410511.1 sugar phosphate isomerase/epimerase [Saccharibacillus sp. CPCC 101409]
MQHEIKIGALVEAVDALRIIPQIARHGFESFQLTFWQTTRGTDLAEFAKQIGELAEEHQFVVSGLGVFGNALTNTGDHADMIDSWKRLIDAAPLFGTNLVSGFTGRIPGEPIPASMPRYTEVFGELSKRAEANGTRIVFENCPMDGTWKTGDYNIAHNPSAWEMMFNALPADNIGLEWEPCHQMINLMDPIAQLRKWTDKIYHVHGKDATIAWDVIREHGIHSPHPFYFERTPGFGDCNWTDVITILRQAGYKGSIDIEGYHDPVYRGELEMTGQVYALNHLKHCRGGAFVPNPS